MKKDTKATINLNAISTDGNDFIWTEADQDLTEKLEKKVANHPYQLALHLHPVGKHYELQGDFKGEASCICARCTIDFKYPLKFKFREILAPEWAEKMKKSQNPKDFFDSEVELITGLEQEDFHIADYLNEQINFEIPPYPKCSSDCKGLCQECGKSLNDDSCKCLNNKQEGHIAFSALKNLKIDSKH